MAIRPRTRLLGPAAIFEGKPHFVTSGLVKYEFVPGYEALDAYEAGRALLGISRTLSISAHFFVNEEVITQSTALKHAGVFVRPFEKASFGFPFDVWLPTMNDVGNGVVGTAFWEMGKYIWNKAIGRKGKIESDLAKEKIDRLGGATDAVAAKIETSLKDATRPLIEGAGASTAFIIAGNNNTIVNIDRDAKEYLDANIIDKQTSSFVGTVPRFDVNTGSGGMFVFSEGRVISFKPEGSAFSRADNIYLSSSLRAWAAKKVSEVEFEGRAVRTLDGSIKMILVTKIVRPTTHKKAS